MDEWSEELSGKSNIMQKKRPVLEERGPRARYTGPHPCMGHSCEEIYEEALRGRRKCRS